MTKIQHRSERNVYGAMLCTYVNVTSKETIKTYHWPSKYHTSLLRGPIDQCHRIMRTIVLAKPATDTALPKNAGHLRHLIEVERSLDATAKTRSTTRTLRLVNRHTSCAVEPVSGRLTV